MHYFFEHFGETGKHSFGSIVGQVIFFTSFKYGYYFCSFWMTSIYIFWKSNLKTMFQKIINFTEEISGNKTNIIIPCTYFQREKSSFWCINKKLLIWYIELFPWRYFSNPWFDSGFLRASFSPMSINNLFWLKFLFLLFVTVRIDMIWFTN